MSQILITNGILINEGDVFCADILIKNERVEKISGSISTGHHKTKVIDAKGLMIMPGMIDAHVHFREPGLTHKGDLRTESMAALAGGVTSVMDMPNTLPHALTLDLLEQKYNLAQKNSLVNYSFFMGVSTDNLEEVLRVDKEKICGISDDGLYQAQDGKLLSDYPDFLESLFSRSNSLIAIHCEDSAVIGENFDFYNQLYEGNIPARLHPMIHTELACVKATKAVVGQAGKYAARVHILHLSTEAELKFFDNTIDTRNKRITSEVCLPHLWFTESDLADIGNKIKCNPSVKARNNRAGLIRGLKDAKIDTIGTDHAPHTLSEKSNEYTSCPSGIPMIQCALPALFELYHNSDLTLEQIIQKTSHNVADAYRIKERGYLREGYYADLTIVNPDSPWLCTDKSVISKCGWSPLNGYTFRSQIIKTIVNGQVLYDKGEFPDLIPGKRLLFEKER